MIEEETKQADKTTAHESQLVIEEANRDIRLFDKYKKLTENDEFIEVIIKGFLQDYSTELFQELMDGTVSTNAEMEAKMRKMEGIGALTEYVTKLHEKAQIAVERIKRENKFLAESGA